jgi:hypothetical protein
MGGAGSYQRRFILGELLPQSGTTGCERRHCVCGWLRRALSRQVFAHCSLSTRNRVALARSFHPLVFIEATAGHFRHSQIRVRSSQADQNQHSDVRRMVSLPHVLVSYFSADFLRFFPIAAGVVAVRLECSLYLRDALRTWL